MFWLWFHIHISKQKCEKNKSNAPFLPILLKMSSTKKKKSAHNLPEDIFSFKK